MCSKLMLSFMSKSSVTCWSQSVYPSMQPDVAGCERQEKARVCNTPTFPCFHVCMWGVRVRAWPCSCIMAATVEQHILCLIHQLRVCFYNYFFIIFIIIFGGLIRALYDWLCLGWISVLFP